MNILLITGLYDLRPSSGGSYLMREYVKQLRNSGNTVKLFYFTSADTDPRAAATEKDTWYLPDLRDGFMASKPIYKKLARKLREKLSSKPELSEDTVVRYFKKDLSWALPAINAVVNISAIDIVQVDFHWIMNIVDHLPKHLPMVYVSHEAQFVMAQRKGHVKEAERLQQIEMELALKYNALLTLTNAEAKMWEHADPALKVISSPMGITIPNADIAPKAQKLVFVGSGKHQPNLEGISYFLNEAWPLIRAKHPDLRIAITGLYEEKFMAEHAHIEGVDWVGFVDSLPELLYGAISIVPVRLGSGIRVKILESLALGAAVVSTKNAVEGIAVEDKLHLLIADTPTEIADAVTELYSDPVRYHQLSSSGRDFVRSNYDLADNTQDRIRLFEELTKA